MGTRLDLRSQGVEAPLEVVSVTLRAESDGAEHVDIFLDYEPLASAELARAGGWRDADLTPTLARRGTSGTSGDSRATGHAARRVCAARQ